MKSISKIAKALVAIILVASIAFIGYRYYLENSNRENRNDTMDTIYTSLEDEKNKITYEEVDDETKNNIAVYISSIYADFQGGDPLPSFDDIRNIDIDYIETVAYLNVGIVDGNDPEKFYYSYDELNTIVVNLFGKNAHNLFPRQDLNLFSKETEGYYRAGTHGSETISYQYLIDDIKLGSDGKYYVSLIEYIYETPNGPALDLEYDGSKEFLKNIENKIVREYVADVFMEDEYTMVSVTRDQEGNQVTADSEAEFIKNNSDKFPKTNIVLEYDKELERYYLVQVK